jgi:hypothetical protein
VAKADIRTAAKLLAKAESTPYEAEAIALVERCYSVLAQVMAAYDEAHPAGSGPRRRERRRLLDRRRDRRAAPPAPAGTPSAAAARYGAVGQAPGRDTKPNGEVSLLL